MEPMEHNPILEQENYFKQYQASIEQLKNHPEVLTFDKLCYELFEANPTGRKFIEYAENRYIFPSLAQRGSATYQIDVIWGEGFKEAFRTIKNAVTSHKQRIKSEMNK